jgi:hypothetical protein
MSSNAWLRVCKVRAGDRKPRKGPNQPRPTRLTETVRLWQTARVHTRAPRHQPRRTQSPPTTATVAAGGAVRPSSGRRARLQPEPDRADRDRRRARANSRQAGGHALGWAGQLPGARGAHRQTVGRPIQGQGRGHLGSPTTYQSTTPSHASLWPQQPPPAVPTLFKRPCPLPPSSGRAWVSTSSSSSSKHCHAISYTNNNHLVALLLLLCSAPTTSLSSSL